jgi:BlaI family penicillinase repressor
MAQSPIGLGKLQLRIMQILWRGGEATARQITGELNRSGPVAHSTVQTILRKLEAKGAVTHEGSGHVFVFRPLSQREEVTQTAAHDLLTRVFGGSVYGLVSHFLEHETVPSEERARLRELIERATEE